MDRRGNKWCVPVLAAALTSGCGVLDPRGGVADYSAKPFLLPNGQVICCKVRVKNTKDVGSVVIHFEKDAEGYISLIVGEEDVNATHPSRVTSEQNAQVMARFLQMILQAGVPAP